MVSVAKTAWVISGNASQFSAAVSQAERDAQKLTISLQSQLDKVNLVGRGFDAYQLALAGASRESVAQVEALQQQVAQAEAYQQALNRSAAIIQSVMTAEERHSHTLTELNSLLRQGMLTTEQYDRAVRAARESLSRANGVSAEAQAAAQRQRDAEQQRAAQMQRAQQITESLRTPTERIRQAIDELNAALRRGDISTQTYHRGVQRLNQQAAQARQAQQQFGAGCGNAMFAVQQLAFGVQDAASVYGQMGFTGAVRAASNNIVQFASLIGPATGVVTALAITGLQLGIDYFNKYGEAAEKAGEKVLKAFSYSQQLSQQRVSDFKRQQNLNKEAEGANSTEQIKRLRKDHSDRRKELQVEIQEEKQLRSQLEYATVTDLFGNARTVRRARNKAEQEALKSQFGEQAPAMMTDEEKEKADNLYNSILEKDKERRALLRQDDRLAQRQTEVGMEEEAAEQEKRQKQRDEDAKKAEETAKRHAKDVQAFEKSLRHQDNSAEGKARKVVDEFKERQAKIEELFPEEGDPNRKRLLDMAVASAEAELNDMQKSVQKKTEPFQFSGAAEAGSREAYSSMLANRFSQMENKKGIDPAQQKIIDSHKEEIKQLKDIAKNTNQQPQVVQLAP